MVQETVKSSALGTTSHAALAIGNAGGISGNGITERFSNPARQGALDLNQEAEATNTNNFNMVSGAKPYSQEPSANTGREVSREDEGYVLLMLLGHYYESTAELNGQNLDPEQIEQMIKDLEGIELDSNGDIDLSSASTSAALATGVTSAAAGLSAAQLRENGAFDGSYDEAFDKVLAHEGGWHDGKYDAGGATVFGIASKYHQGTYNEVMGLLRSGDREGALEVTKDFYKREFWDKAGIENISDPAARLVAFDTAVNAGVGKARQHIATASRNDGVADGNELVDLKRNHYASLNATGKAVYTRNYRGWMNRCDSLQEDVDQVYASARTPALAANEPQLALG